MPKLIRLYITHCAIGFGIAVAFVVMLVWLDVAHLRHLVLETEKGWLAGLMMVLANGVVFAGVQFAIAVMRMADTPEEPTGGRRVPVVRMEPVRVEARASATPRR